MTSIRSLARRVALSAGLLLAAASASADPVENGNNCDEFGFLAEQIATARQFDTQSIDEVLGRVADLGERMRAEGRPADIVEGQLAGYEEMVLIIFSFPRVDGHEARLEEVAATRRAFEDLCHDWQ